MPNQIESQLTAVQGQRGNSCRDAKSQIEHIQQEIKGVIELKRMTSMRWREVRVREKGRAHLQVNISLNV